MLKRKSKYHRLHKQKVQQEKRKEELLKISKEQKQIEEFVKKKSENFERFQKNIDNEKSILMEKTSENEKLKSEVEVLTNKISDIDQSLAIKKQTLQDLMQQDIKIKNSVIYMNYNN